MKEKSGAAGAAIFLAHAELLSDPELLARTDRRIADNESAGWAWRETIEEEAESLARLPDPLLASRATDLRDVGTRVLRRLAGAIEEAAAPPEEPAILLAEDLTPSDAAALDPARVLGFCTSGGGPTSHAAIIARSLGIPAVVGAGPAAVNQQDGVPAVLDGDNGFLYLDPSAEDLAAAREAQLALADLRGAEHRARYEPALTTDGVRVEVVANTGLAKEAAQAVEAGGEGIGLMRSEFLFLERATAPSEEEQYTAYREAAEALGGLPLIVRTLDIGGDKAVPYLDMPAEENPFLGVRGIRLCLAHPELFRTQLRAIFRASAHGSIKIMYPMIASVSELREALAITEEVRQEVGAEKLEARDHDRGAVGGGDGLRAGGSRGFLFDRHQRPDAVRAGDGPRPSAARPAGRRSASGGAADDRSDRAGGGGKEHLGRRLRRRGGGAAGRGDPDRPRRHRASP